MQTRKPTSNSPQHLKPQSLKKVNLNDHFPCFNCFDHPKEKTNCSECHGNGWILGSHPMVQFAEDFIEKRLGINVSNQSKNTSLQQYEFGQSFGAMGGSSDPYKKPKQIYPTSSVRTLNDEIRTSRKKNQSQELTQQYFCNECITQQPINGTRYHCTECEDYDLCENCFNSGCHSEHSLQEIKAKKKLDNETLVAQNKKLNLLKKSIKVNKKPQN